jgi:thymidylate synthase
LAIAKTKDLEFTPYIEARDLSEAWFLALRECLSNGYDYQIEKGSFVDTWRKELDFFFMRINDPGRRPLVPSVPQGVPAPTSMEYIEKYMEYLMTSNKQEKNQSYSYGHSIEKQIFKIIDDIKRYGPNNNQTCMRIGTPESVNLEDPECLTTVDVRVRYGKINFFVYFRSWDLWGGFPSNLGGIQLMKEFMANEIGVEDGCLLVASKGAHLYEYAVPLARRVAGFD